MNLEQWKRIFLSLAMMLIIAILLAFASGCATKTVVTTYDSAGNITKVETSERDAFDKVTEATKDKVVIAWKAGWLGGASASIATTEDPTPHAKIYAGKINKGYIGIPKSIIGQIIEDKSAIDWTGIAKVISATNQSLSVSPDGISEKKKE